MLFFIALMIFILYCLNDSNKLYARRRNYHAEHPPHWKQEEYMLCCEAFHDNIVANDPQTIEEMVDQMRDALIDGRRALLHKGFLPLSCDHLTPASDQERRQMEHDLSLPNWDVILPLCWPPSIDRVKDLTANGESLDFSIYPCNSYDFLSAVFPLSLLVGLIIHRTPRLSRRITSRSG